MTLHELISLAEPERWAAALAEVRHGHAHTWGFCHALQKTSGLPTYLYRYASDRARVVCPIAEREHSGLREVVSPYGIAGFVSRGNTPRFVAEWTDFASSQEWVCAYVALHPLLHSPGGFEADQMQIHHRLYVIALQQSDDDLLQAMSRKRRAQLRNWSMVEEGLIRDRGQLTTFLLNNYEAFFSRRRAGSASQFKQETIYEIAALPDVLMIGRGRGSEPEAVAVWGYSGEIAESLFSVSIPGGEIHGVPLTWAGARTLRSAGVKWLNLGGGVQPGDSIAESKRRFGACEKDLVSIRQVFRSGVYAELCREAGQDCNDRAGYFPAYRRQP